MAKPKQLELGIKPKFKHGGARKGAGRPRLSDQQSHVPRPRIQGKHPLHVTLKLRKGLPSLRHKDVFRCFREAVKTSRRQGLAITQFAILSNHVHLMVEAKDNRELRKMFQSLGISFAKRVNRLANRQGAIWQDRFHLHVLKTPTEVRNVLRYILGNENKHREGAAWFKIPKPCAIRLGLFSSAAAFSDWSRLFGRIRLIHEDKSGKIADWLGESLVAPETWLLRYGWKRA